MHIILKNVRCISVFNANSKLYLLLALSCITTRTHLVKWFWASYLVSTAKRGLSALELSRKSDIGMKCAWTILHKIRKAMKARDATCQLTGLIQVDDAFFQRGRGQGGRQTWARDQ